MPAAAQRKLILIDAMALIYRGHFALISSPRMTSKGMNTSAVFVFMNVLLELLTNESPDYLAVAFDTPEPTHRHKEYTEYKAQREAMPEDIAIAIPYVNRLCEAMNIPVLRAPGWEADDIVGTLTARADAAGLLTYMVTSDKDFGQLVSPTSLLYRPRTRGAGYDILGVKEVLAQWEIQRVDQVIDVLGLMGDASDNIPGVPGIGPKTARQLIAQYDTVENLLAHLDELKGKRREMLEAHQSDALLSKRLATIDRNVPIDIPIESLAVRKPDDAALQALFAELEFKTLAKRVVTAQAELNLDDAPVPAVEPNPPPPPAPAATPAGAPPGVDLATIETTRHTYTLVEDAAGRDALLKKLLAQKSVCFDSETTGLDPKTCTPVGLAFSWRAHEACYVALPRDPDAARRAAQDFRPFFENAAIEKIGHNLKFDLGVLRWCGVRVTGPIFDTMIAASLTMPEVRRTMDALSEALLKYRPVPITALIGEEGDGQRTMADVDVRVVAEYAGEDADITWQLAGALRPLLKTFNQEKVFYEIEAPLIPVLVEMEYEGIRLDPAALVELARDLEGEIARTATRVFELAGGEFALNSPKQLGAILFEKLALDPNARRTQKSGQYVTNEQVLARLATRHEIAQQILDYRMCTKLKSTYVDMLPAAVFPRTGRVHTHYEQAVTATGRMQSHDPNLQNIPVRSEKGREIRKAFVPRDDRHLLLAADYSQIELRIAAEMSGDAGLMAAFDDATDIHTATAARLNGVAAAEVTPEMRRRAKMVNFGILYGISAFGLAERTGIPRAEAGELIDAYFQQYPGLRAWMDTTLAFAHAHGYVETMTGRRRYLRDINSRNGTTARAEERNAINAPVQGTAADMIKIAMTRIQRELDAQKLRSRMLLQVHDELVFDMPRDEEAALREIVERCMRTAIPTRVPIVVELGVGANWLDAH